MGVLIAFCHGFGLCGCPALFCLALLLRWWLSFGCYYFPLLSGDGDGGWVSLPCALDDFCLSLAEFLDGEFVFAPLLLGLLPVA